MKCEVESAKVTVKKTSLLKHYDVVCFRDDNSFGSKIKCINCAQTEIINKKQKKVIEGLQAQTNVMKRLSDHKFTPNRYEKHYKHTYSKH